jgi:hypothetical protein
MNFWWIDDNADSLIGFQELYWHTSSNFAAYRAFDDSGNFIGDWDDARGTFWGAYDPLNPTQLTDPTTTIADDAKRGPRARELDFTVEHELMTDFMIGVNFTYKIYDNYNWTLQYWPDTGKIDSKDEYVQVGTIPSTIGGESTGEAGGKPYYLRNAAYTSTAFRIEVPRPDYNHKYYGVDFTWHKRMSNNWMLNGSVTLQKDSIDFGSNGYTDPTNNWAIEGRPLNNRFPTWIAKLQALYRFPWGIHVGFSLFARNTQIITEQATITDINSPNFRDRSVTVRLAPYGDLRNDPELGIALKLEKMFRALETGRVYISADIFNLPNFSSVVRRYNRDLGTYYVHDGSNVPASRSLEARQIINPRAMRLGVRFQF